MGVGGEEAALGFYGGGSWGSVGCHGSLLLWGVGGEAVELEGRLLYCDWR